MSAPVQVHSFAARFAALHDHINRLVPTDVPGETRNGELLATAIDGILHLLEQASQAARHDDLPAAARLVMYAFSNFTTLSRFARAERTPSARVERDALIERIGSPSQGVLRGAICDRVSANAGALEGALWMLANDLDPPGLTPDDPPAIQTTAHNPTSGITNADPTTDEVQP